MDSKVILGIDPGSYNTGFGIIKICVKTKKPTYITSGIVKLSHITEFDAKLVELYKNISEIVYHYKPDIGAIEDLFVYKNVKSAIKLSHARAACILALANANIKFRSYSPRLVKKIVTGHGGADKDSVQYMVKSILNLPSNHIIKADASDALAIALTRYYDSNNILTV